METPTEKKAYCPKCKVSRMHAELEQVLTCLVCGAEGKTIQQRALWTIPNPPAVIKLGPSGCK